MDDAHAARSARTPFQYPHQSPTYTPHGAIWVIASSIPYLVVGLGWTAFGVALIVLTATSVPELESLTAEEAAMTAPSWTAGVAGIGVALAGVVVLIWIIAAVLSALGRSRGAATHPGEPWRYDHGWDRDGSRDDSEAPGCALIAAIVGTLFLVPFNVALMRPAVLQEAGAGLCIALPVLVVIDLVLFHQWSQLIHGITRGRGLGAARLRWDHLPLRLGEEAVLRLALPPTLRGVDSITVTLRCIEEDQTLGVRQGQVTWSALHTESRVIGRDALAGEEVELRFQLASDAPPTALSAQPGVFWDVEVAAPEIDYEGHFLLPVYA